LMRFFVLIIIFFHSIKPEIHISPKCQSKNKHEGLDPPILVKVVPVTPLSLFDYGLNTSRPYIFVAIDSSSSLDASVWLNTTRSNEAFMSGR